MKKVKYFYNTHSLRYEKFEESLRTKALRAVGFISAALVFSSIIIYIAYTYLDSPKEKVLRRELNEMTLQYESMDKQLSQMQAVLADLQDRDDNIYRVIFEAEPIPSTVREAGTGGVNRYKELMNFSNGELMKSTMENLDKIRGEMYIQSKSYDQISLLVKNREEVLASIPAIMPVANKDLKRIASGFGVRIDPIYKVPKMHEGLDFTAPIGTPIHATGNATVTKIEYNNRGYGNNVLLTHMVGYQTLYAHMSRVAVREGQKVKRGDVIGYVGSSGKSTGPHCHYEVWKNGTKLDPVNFFFNDLTPLQYEELLKIADQANQSFD